MRWVLLALAGAAISHHPGIAAAQKQPVRSLLELRQDRVVMQRWDLSCGAAILATVLSYDLDLPISEREVALAMLEGLDPDHVRTRGGFSLLDMKRYVEKRGFKAAGYRDLTIDALVQMAPAIVPTRLDGLDHFVLVRGRENGRLLLADPNYGNRVVAVEEFIRHWDGIAFVVRRQK